MFLLRMLALCLWPLAAVPAAAEPTLFAVDVVALEKGGIQHRVVPFADGAALAASPDWAELDAMNFAANKASVAVAKWAVVLARPAGFFNEQNMAHPKWIRNFFPDLQLREDGENKFISTDGKTKIEVFFDSDDMSNLRPRRLVHAVARSRSLDPVTQGAFASFVLWRHGGGEDELAMFNVVPLEARKTLLVGYMLRMGEREREGALKALLARAKLAQTIILD